MGGFEPPIFCLKTKEFFATETHGNTRKIERKISVSFCVFPRLILKRLEMKLPDNITAQVKSALEEDIATGDVTADLIPEENQSSATVICRDDAILSGVAWFNEVFRQIDSDVKITWNFKDGDHVKANGILCTLSGNARAILSGERAALNFVQTLSATATLTNQFVEKITGTKTKILDTRKTLPNLRDAQNMRCFVEAVKITASAYTT